MSHKTQTTSHDTTGPDLGLPTPRRGAGRPRRTYRPCTAQERQQAQQHAVEWYTDGQSIRAVAARLDRSYGFVHALLAEVGVLRLPGPRRSPKASQPAQKPAGTRR